MTLIEISYHLLIPAIMSLAGLVLLLVKRKALRKKNPFVYKSGLIFLFTYTLLVGNALGHDLYYQWDLNQYDLNQNGLFESPIETTQKQALAMERLINDTGRNSAFISAFIVSGILSLSMYIIMKVNDALLGSDEPKNTNNLNNIQIQ